MAAALEGAVNQQQGDSDGVEPVYADSWTDDVFTTEIEQLGSQWDFSTADTENLLHDVCLTIPPPYGSSIGSTTTGSDSAVSAPSTLAFDDTISLETRATLAAFEDPNGFCTTNVSTLMQAEL